MELLLLVRHGLAGSNRDRIASCAVPGEGLTPEGVEQGRRLATLLSAEEIALGTSTELARTRETLELALGARGVPRLVVGDLNEIAFGSYADGPLDEYRAWAASHPPAAPSPGGGESRAVVAARFAQGLRCLLERPEPVVLHVGHALAVRYVIDAAKGLAPAPLMAPVEHAVPFTLQAADVETAADLLDAWSRAPRFRDHSIG
ncbi:MAG: histidine phosphatase family protein [Gaiellaceae bacterium]